MNNNEMKNDAFSSAFHNKTGSLKLHKYVVIFFFIVYIELTCTVALIFSILHKYIHLITLYDLL